MKYVLPLCLAVTLFGQTELHLPWVAQNQTFQSTIIFNNYNAHTVTLNLQASRSSEMPENQMLDIGPYGSVRISAATLFPGMGEGQGYRVAISSEADNLAAGVIIASTTTASGDSPSQMNAIATADASTRLTFNYLPIIASGFSAPVVVNLGDEPAQVSFRGFQNGEEIGTFQQMLAAGEVFAEQTAELFPEVEGGLYIVAECDLPLVGSTFLFNGLLEPALAPAYSLPPTTQP